MRRVWGKLCEIPGTDSSASEWSPKAEVYENDIEIKVPYGQPNPTSYPMDAGGSFPGCKVAGA
jgi:hypothetical protein